MKNLILNSQYLRDIVAKSSTLEERKIGFVVPVSGVKSTHTKERVNHRLEAWYQSSAGGDRALFEKQLKHRGFLIDKLEELLGEFEFPPEKSLPLWTSILEISLSKFIHGSPNQLYDRQSEYLKKIIDEYPIPFDKFMLPFIETARQEIYQKSNGVYENLLTRQAQAELEYSLLEQISEIISPTLYKKFKIFKKVNKFFILSQTKKSCDNSSYLYFLEKMFQDDIILDFFYEYSVIARLVSLKTLFWVKQNSLMIKRFIKDKPDIEVSFSNSSSLDKVIDLIANLSDPHNFGGTVAILKFANGLNLVYKPKDIRVEREYNKFITRSIERGEVMDQITPQVISRQGYGWSSYIQFNNCTSKEAVQRYFRRAGELLCFLYVLREKDCHAENIIAAGEYPVVVDLETLISPCCGIKTNNTEAYQSYLDIENSIFRTATLFHDDLGSFGESGLGSLPGQDSYVRVSRWYYINTDKMLKTCENSLIPNRENLPYLNNEICHAKDYKEFIKKGFKNAYLFLMKNRIFCRQEGGLLTGFECSMYSRFVARSSQLYYAILERASRTNLLNFGVDRSISIESLRKIALPFTCEDSNFQRILDSECQQLEVLDIPIFYASTNSKSLTTIKHGEVLDFFENTGYESVCLELDALNLGDLKKQLNLIDLSLSE